MMAQVTPAPLFSKSLLVSVAFHALLVLAYSIEKEFSFFSSPPPSVLEIDLTRPFRLTQDPRLARRSPNPGTGAPVVRSPTPMQDPLPQEVKPKPIQDWVLPGPKTEVLVKPEDGQENTPTGLGGLGTGSGDGEVDWIYLTDLPKMLNRADMAKLLRKFYPEVERRAGREGVVALDLHLDASGRVASVDVVESAGKLFDDASKKVVHQARFSPARVGKKPVPVKIRQSITFQLD